MAALHSCNLRLVIYAVIYFFAFLFPNALSNAASPDEIDFLEAGDPNLAGGYSSKNALLTIFYNASTHGVLYPCPT